jgi:hypothetical protein
MTSKIYTNDSYTRTVELVKNTGKCEEYGWTKTVKVTTVWNDTFNLRGGETRTTVAKWWTTDEWLSYETFGVKYWSK